MYKNDQLLKNIFFQSTLKHHLPSHFPPILIREKPSTLLQSAVGNCQLLVLPIELHSGSPHVWGTRFYSKKIFGKQIKFYGPFIKIYITSNINGRIHNLAYTDKVPNLANNFTHKKYAQEVYCMYSLNLFIFTSISKQELNYLYCTDKVFIRKIVCLCGNE